MQDEMSFGTWLKERRRALDITQWDLAERVGCAEDTIQKIESNARRPSRQMAELLVEILEVPTQERAAMVAFARTGASPPPSTLDPSKRRVVAAEPVHAPPPTNLPVPLTGLMGREDALQTLTDQLKRPERRLITLVGPPGIGKTRLALGVGAACLDFDSFKDGVYFVPLAPVHEPSFVPNAIAQALGLPDSGNQPLLENLREYLRGKEMLILLDNFEQVVVAAPSVVELLTACPRVKVLVTSRELLQVRGETPYTVLPLALPDLEHLPSPEELRQSPAVALFSERAESTRPDFALVGANAPAVAAICARLGGLPLAIELAAARTRLLSPDEILSQLDRSLSLLVGGPRDLPTRQQTLKAAIEWSYDLLSHAEQTLLARLSVFAGGATFPAVEAVCNARGDLALSVPEGLDSLVAKSLVYIEKAAEAHFSMLEMIREYALERLAACEELEIMRELHAQFYLGLAEAAEAQLTGPEQGEWLERLEREHDNVRAALGWALATGRGQLAARLAGSTWRFWYMHTHISEGQQWLARVLAEGGSLDPALRAKLLHGAGGFAYRQGDYVKARECLEEALPLRKQLGDEASTTAMLFSLGGLALHQGHYDDARAHYQDALALNERLGNARGSAMVLNSLGWVEMNQGNFEEAEELFQGSYERLQEVGDTWGTADSIASLGWVAFYSGDYERAASRGEEALAMFRQLGDKERIAAVLALAGRGALWRGGHTGRSHAGKRLRESVMISRDIGGQVGASLNLLGFAEMALLDGQPERATRILAASDAIHTITEAFERHQFERCVDETKAKMDHQAWQAAWREGRTMNLSQVIAFALTEPESP